MSKPKFTNNNSSLKNKTSSSMLSNPLMDALTSHISLYHSSISNNSSSLNRNPNPRSSILKWFTSLTVHQRQASVTIVNLRFVQILLQMLGKMRTQGHGFFFVLPDLPSRDSVGTPSLCFRKSNGLLARASEVNEGERFVYEGVRMFESKEGERVEECSCSVECLDTVTVSEEFVADVDRFVAAMDGVSNGEFLRGEENVVGSNDWIELGWLKDKGYYSVEAFVANRIEVALRLAWLNSNKNKKRGVKLKEKVDVAGVAANVYWRKKGCVDWWGNLDAAMRMTILTGVLGKAAKPLTDEILNGASKGTKGEMCIFSRAVEKPPRYNYSKARRKTTVVSIDAAFGSLIVPTSVSTNHTPFTKCLNRLFVLLDICTLVLSCHHHEYDKDKLFYSTLGSISTISDCILRKLRGLLMVVSLDCIKLELLGEGSQGSTPIKCKEKNGAGNRRKKSKTRSTKRLNHALESSGVDEPLKSTFQNQRCESTHKENGNPVESEKVSVIHLEKNREVSSSAIEMEHPRNLEAKGNNAARKRRERKKTKKSTPNTISRNIEASSNDNSNFQGNTLELDGRSDDSSVQNGVKDNSQTAHCIPNSSLNNSVNWPLKEEIAPVSISNVISGCHNDITSHQNLKSSIANPVVFSSEVDKLSNTVDCSFTITTEPSPNQLGSAFSSKSCNFWNTGHSSGNRSKSVDKATDKEQECEVSFNTERTSSMDCMSYEWPNVAPIHSSTVKSPIPAATDRLHLDAGRNWHNHFHHSFVPAMHQTRNPSIEGGCSRMASRPLPVSLDWPPMVRAGGLAPSVACNYDYKFISRRQSSFQQAFTARNVRIKATTIDDERKYFGDSTELSDPTNTQNFTDDGDSHWISEEEYEMHAISGMDYNQYFGGGVMYWDPSDIPGTSFSRPPSLSSDDSSWAWHEVEMKMAVDDMVAFSSSYSTNGLTSPTAASYCSPFDPLGTAHQALGYVMPGNEVTGMVMHPASAVTDANLDDKVSGSLATLPSDVEGKSGDALPYPILPPIIIPNLSRERSRSEFKRSHEHRSPCVPPFRRDQPRIKRPPSPVVLCVPQAPPRPPPPSPVSNSRKHRGFPTVRSGSSSPRNWGVKGWYNDGANFDESCICMDGTEIILPSWRSNNLSTRPMVQPLPGALLPDHMIAISHMTHDKEHPDVTIPIEPPDSLTCLTWKTSRPLMQNILHDEIDSFCKQVAAENITRKPYINWAVNRVTRALQVLWPRSRTNIFGSIATGLSLPSSDVDLVVGLPPVRNLEPIKEAGILEGRNGIKETCLQHAARYLSNQEWVKSDSLKTVENTAIPIIMLVVEVPYNLITNVTSPVPPKDEATCTTSDHSKQVHVDVDGLQNSDSPSVSNLQDEYGKNPKLVRIDISFKSPSHTGVQTTKLVKELTELFPAATPLALVLKQFLADRSLDQSYCGGLSSYCLILLITRFLQHEHHLGRFINQNFGSLLMDFLYFFGNVYDPRQMRISVQGSGVYIKRERGYSIDPIHIDDPLFPTNNVGRNCFRIHQCIKAFSDAYSLLESELPGIPTDGGLNTIPPCRLLPKIIPSIDHYRKFKD